MWDYVVGLCGTKKKERQKYVSKISRRHFFSKDAL